MATDREEPGQGPGRCGNGLPKGCRMEGFRVGLFVAGVQKAGTTTLFRHLLRHPGLLAPSGKDIHFFDDETVDWTCPDARRLHAFYAADPQGRIAFDCTPVYAFWTPSFARIARYNPDARIALIFRDPIERAWSHWRMTRRKGTETLGFSAAIREGRERMRDLAPLDPARRVFSYVERGFYAAQVRRAMEVFPRRNLLFLSFHDLSRGHMQVLGEISAFLGIEPFPDLPARHDHPNRADGHVLDPVDVAYLRGLFRDEMRDFAGLTGISTEGWLTMQDG